MRTSIILVFSLYLMSTLISAQLPNYYPSSNAIPNPPTLPSGYSGFRSPQNYGSSQYNSGYNAFQPQSSTSFPQYQPYNNRIPSFPRQTGSYPNFPQFQSSGFASYPQSPASVVRSQPAQSANPLSVSFNVNHALSQPQQQFQSTQFQPQPQQGYSASQSIPQSFPQYRPQTYSPPQSYSPPALPSPTPQYQSYQPQPAPQPYNPPSLPSTQPQYQSYQPQPAPQPYNPPSLPSPTPQYQSYQPQPAPQPYNPPSLPSPQPQYQPQSTAQQSFQSTNQISSAQNSQNFNSAPVHYANIGSQLNGDYKFGYHTGDGGSFREESRNADGSVSGAYGFVDANGKQRIVKYTAGKDGFKAEGDDVPPLSPPISSQSGSGSSSNSLGEFNLSESPAFKSFMQG